MVLIFLPLLLIGTDKVERPHRSVARADTFVTTMTVDASPEEVWEKIKRVDSIEARKPLLMKIGIPVPQRCVVEGEGAGKRRVCYFDAGYIEEQITEWSPPASMKLKVTATTLPGRHWLGFRDASYEIRKEGNRTIVTRQT